MDGPRDRLQFRQIAPRPAKHEVEIHGRHGGPMKGCRGIADEHGFEAGLGQPAAHLLQQGTRVHGGQYSRSRSRNSQAAVIAITRAAAFGSSGRGFGLSVQLVGAHSLQGS